MTWDENGLPTSWPPGSSPVRYNENRAPQCKAGKRFLIFRVVYAWLFAAKIVVTEKRLLQASHLHMLFYSCKRLIDIHYIVAWYKTLYSVENLSVGKLCTFSTLSVRSSNQCVSIRQHWWIVHAGSPESESGSSLSHWHQIVRAISWRHFQCRSEDLVSLTAYVIYNCGIYKAKGKMWFRQWHTTGLITLTVLCKVSLCTLLCSKAVYSSKSYLHYSLNLQRLDECAVAPPDR